MLVLPPWINLAPLLMASSLDLLIEQIYYRYHGTMSISSNWSISDPTLNDLILRENLHQLFIHFQANNPFDTYTV